jgi:hypothetical protein
VDFTGTRLWGYFFLGVDDSDAYYHSFPIIIVHYLPIRYLLELIVLNQAAKMIVNVWDRLYHECCIQIVDLDRVPI